jgi:hypothetical protein
MEATAAASSSSSPAAAALSRGRQAREMSAMVAALARVVAGSAPPAKRPHQGAVQEEEVEEAWWPYDELDAEPSPAFVLDGKNARHKNCMAFCTVGCSKRCMDV